MVYPIPREAGHKLTGKRRHRSGWHKKLILQVEVTYYTYTWVDRGWGGVNMSEPKFFWRDARIEDISEGDLV